MTNLEKQVLIRIFPEAVRGVDYCGKLKRVDKNIETAWVCTRPPHNDGFHVRHNLGPPYDDINEKNAILIAVWSDEDD